MFEVHSDARPGFEATTHTIDEDVRGLEVRGRLWMARLPFLETAKRIFLLRRPGDLDERFCRLPSPGRLHTRRLTRLLSVMRGPRRITQAFPFVAG